MKSRAVVATAPGRVEFQYIDVPEPGAEDVVVRVHHSWISNGTDGSFVRGERIGGDTPRRPGDPLPFPHVPGYQKTGVIESVGKGVAGLEPGDLVFATVSRVEGMFFGHGGHVSPAVTHQSQVWKLPPGSSSVGLSGLVLAQVGYNVGCRPVLQEGDAGVVIGDGLVGHWSAQVLAHRGARVMLVGRHDDRLRLFECRPGDRTLNSREQDPIDAARSWAPQGVQVIADTAGSVETLQAFFPLMKSNGQLVSAGFCGTNGLIDVQRMRERELTLHTPSGWNRPRMDATLELIVPGILRTETLITHRFPADRAAEAFDLILGRREPVLGVVLDWEGK